MFSEAPPSRELLTTSLTCLLFVEVNTLTSSGIRAPASVPREMIAASFHHNPLVAPTPRTRYVVRNVNRMQTTEVTHTNELSGSSKFIRSAVA